MIYEDFEKAIKEAILYDSITGKFYWKKHYIKRLEGKEAGNVSVRGYRTIEFNHKQLRAGRLAWFLFYGKWPLNVIDHINGNRDDNRICNLRDVSLRTNSSNTKKHRDGHIVGTHLHGKRWGAQILCDNKYIHLGYFSTQEEAGMAYQKAVKKEGEE